MREQARIGRLLDAEPVPETAAELSRWVAEHPAIAPSPGMLEAVTFLRRPPLDPVVKLAYQVLASAAVVTLPPRIRRPSASDHDRVRVRSASPPRRPCAGRWRVAALATGAASRRRSRG